MHFISNLLLLSVEEASSSSAGAANPFVAVAVIFGVAGVFFLALYAIFRGCLEPHRRALAEYNRNATSQMAKADEYADNMWHRMHREEKLLTRIADALEKLSRPQDITRPDGPPPPTAPAAPADAP